MNKKTNLKKFIEPIVLMLIIAIGFFAILVTRNIYPFGPNSLMFADDGYQQNLPVLYYLWDVLHGQKSLFFDWDIAFGSNMAGIVSHFGLLSPINIIYLFIPRNQILYSVTWTGLIRVILLGLSMRYFIKKISGDKLHAYQRIAFSLLYAFSSWSVKYIFFFQWIDIAIIFPLCCAFLIELLNEGKKKTGYVTALTAILILNIQQSFMVLMFIIIFSGVYIFAALSDKKLRKKAICRLGIYTVIALMISAFVFIPAALQVSESQRMGGGNIIYKLKQILRSNADSDKTYVYEKMLIFRSSIISIVLMVIGLVIRRIKKVPFDKMVIGTVILSIIMIVPVFISSVEYVWHAGEYVCFPLRNGHLIVFTLIGSAAYILSTVNDVLVGAKKSSQVNIISIAIISASLIALFAVIRIFVINHMEAADAENENGMIHYGVLVNEAVDINDNLHRYKNTCLHVNFPVVSGVSTEENYLQLMTARMLHTNDYLGYQQDYTIPSDDGGTYFTDSLLGYKYMLTMSETGDEMYSYVDRIEDLYIYENQVEYPFGIFIAEDVDINTYYLQGEDNLFMIQNEISNSVIGCDVFTNIYVLGNEERTLTIEGVESQTIYIYCSNLDFSDCINYEINGETKIYKDGITNAGCYNGSVELNFAMSEYEGPIIIGVFDDSVYKNVIPEEVTSNVIFTKNGVAFDVVNNKEASILFIPVGDSEGWTLKVDGKKTDTITVFGNYIGINIENGEHSVSLTYVSKGRICGIIITLAGLMLLVLDWFKPIDNMLDNSIICSTAFICFILVFCGLLFVGYILNIVFAILPSKYWYFLLGKWS